MKKIIVSLSLVLGISMSVNYNAHSDATKKNQVKESHTTADSQMNMSERDIELTRKIRKRLTDSETLSTRAQNIVIVTDDKSVTLKGEVDKGEEIGQITSVVRDVASGKKINNQLTVRQ